MGINITAILILMLFYIDVYLISQHEMYEIRYDVNNTLPNCISFVIRLTLDSPLNVVI